LCRWDHHIVSLKIINYTLYYIREPGWLVDCSYLSTGCMTEEVGFMKSEGGGEQIFLLCNTSELALRTTVHSTQSEAGALSPDVKHPVWQTTARLHL